VVSAKNFVESADHELEGPNHENPMRAAMKPLVDWIAARMAS